MQQLHFISGLPHSGSTLLSALLAQNPRLPKAKEIACVRDMAWIFDSFERHAAADLFQHFANDAFCREPARRPSALRVV